MIDAKTLDEGLKLCDDAKAFYLEFNDLIKSIGKYIDAPVLKFIHWANPDRVKKMIESLRFNSKARLDDLDLITQLSNERDHYKSALENANVANQLLKNERDELKRKLAVAVEALKFYAEIGTDQECCYQGQQVGEFEMECCGLPINKAILALSKIEPKSASAVEGG